MYCLWPDIPIGPRSKNCRVLEITLPHAMAPLDERSGRRTDLYLKKNTAITVDRQP